MELYGFEYENKQFNNLCFIRKDTICNVVYLTFKDYLTEEVFTFDLRKMENLRFRTAIDSLQVRRAEVLADTLQHSLY
ncbi:hypothetical protein A8F94_02640 [Bacillus sp. FJAT-27225]|nr:hypothetical protein A8F94_02640 [Bacillus sp. FJAT-27225]